MALVTQGPSGTLDSALQPLGLLGVVLGSKRAVSAPGGEDMWTGSGRSTGKDTPFSQTDASLLDTPAESAGFQGKADAIAESTD